MLWYFVVRLFQQFGFNLSHFEAVFPADFLMNDNAGRVIFADQTTGFLLNVMGCQPRLIDILHRVLGKLGNVSTNIVSPRIGCAPESTRVYACWAIEPFFKG